jgi:hypothetical protein
MMSAVPEPRRVSLTAQVDSLYDVRDSGVRRLLSTHPGLTPELVEVAQNVSRYFGLDARLALETVLDPEDDAPDEELYAVISTTLSPTEALARLNAFDQGWWLERSRRIVPQLTATLD